MISVYIINRSLFALPNYETEGSAGMDIRANITDAIDIEPLNRVLIPTGLYTAIPKGFEIQIRPRSGLAFKKGVTVLNSPGTIDSDYRGEIKVLLVNLSSETIQISAGERIAQLVLCRHETIDWCTTDVLPETDRGEGGFGSTGMK
jgi:dUTP pyrophosphatase